MKIKIITVCFFLSFFNCFAQKIEMLWPAFAGKTYDFIIFQGDKQVTAQQDTIAKDGSFVLSVPQEYAPYTGMCRWFLHLNIIKDDYVIYDQFTALIQRIKNKQF